VSWAWGMEKRGRGKRGFGCFKVVVGEERGESIDECEGLPNGIR
jgi:hypothetical protein